MKGRSARLINHQAAARLIEGEKQEHDQQQLKKNLNSFQLSDTQRDSLNSLLPKGYSLIRVIPKFQKSLQTNVIFNKKPGRPKTIAKKTEQQTLQILEMNKKVQLRHKLRQIHQLAQDVRNICLDIGITKETVTREKKYCQRELGYILRMVQALPPACMTGIWDIVEETPFLESMPKIFSIDLHKLSTRKIQLIYDYCNQMHGMIAERNQREQIEMDCSISVKSSCSLFPKNEESMSLLRIKEQIKDEGSVMELISAQDDISLSNNTIYDIDEQS